MTLLVHSLVLIADGSGEIWISDFEGLPRDHFAAQRSVVIYTLH